MNPQRFQECCQVCQHLSLSIHMSPCNVHDSLSLGVLYAYLAEGVGRSKAAEGAFRALSRGFTHWASGRLEHLEINIKNPSYCHVRSNMKPSMKQGSYDVYFYLNRLKKTWPVSELLLVSVLQGMCVTCTYHTLSKHYY